MAYMNDIYPGDTDYVSPGLTRGTRISASGTVDYLAEYQEEHMYEDFGSPGTTSTTDSSSSFNWTLALAIFSGLMTLLDVFNLITLFTG